MRYSERSPIGCQGNLNANWDKLSPLRRSQWRVSALHVDEL